MTCPKLNKGWVTDLLKVDKPSPTTIKVFVIQDYDDVFSFEAQDMVKILQKGYGFHIQCSSTDYETPKDAVERLTNELKPLVPQEPTMSVPGTFKVDLMDICSTEILSLTYLAKP
uniref:Glutaredoxin domain-containing protein n=1 Tax=Panagrellus redivivus TaxID=6233 RepID=A0A7E4VW85_PANRE